MDDREIADRLQIADLLARYGYAVDSGEWDLFDEVFTDDAVIDYRATGGINGSRAEVKDWLAGVLSDWPGRMHLIGTARVRFEPDLSGRDGAQVSAPFTDTLSPSRELIAADAKGLLRGGGWYHHRMLRDGGGWRSRELVVEQTWRTIQ
ncbi:nuclear transport factor 2 family protein [Nonomuraea rhizosphaerae]|uniref:nuclear transport factor 2 family protein n=1 Tax=Nonomuraea rhizosphaerae TaxID=2665663 RepID=UPI001C5F8381|nr:nuclear transport factor 2 family protein [Nonomuraea rhizosphaerae]